MKKAFLFWLVSLSLYAGTVNIAAASNVSDVIAELKTRFIEEHPEATVRITLGSSGKLATQIRHGAPYMLFLSADMRYPQMLYRTGTAVTKPMVYARGALAMLSRHARDFSKGIAVAADPSVKRIAVANPKTAPYGAAAAEAMRHAGLYARLEPKLVYAESVSQTLAFTMTAADLGFVAKSALFSPKMARWKEGKNWASVDSALYTPIEQGMVLLEKGRNDKLSRAFYDFVLSDEAAAVFKRYGYLLK